jgi:hypothetical protein
VWRNGRRTSPRRWRREASEFNSRHAHHGPIAQRQSIRLSTGRPGIDTPWDRHLIRISSGYSLVRQSACFGSMRPEVRILLPCPLHRMSSVIKRRVAHRDRARVSEARGRRFESFRDDHLGGGAWRHATGPENRADLTVDGSTPSPSANSGDVAANRLPPSNPRAGFVGLGFDAG